MRDKAVILREKLAGARKHTRKWQEPKTGLILNLHFAVHEYTPYVYHAEATLEIPVQNGLEYFSISVSDKTRAGALRSVIQRIEDSMWYHFMRSEGVVFRVTGCEMERIYKGYI